MGNWRAVQISEQEWRVTHCTYSASHTVRFEPGGTVTCTCHHPQEYRYACKHALATRQCDLQDPTGKGGVPRY